MHVTTDLRRRIGLFVRPKVGYNSPALLASITGASQRTLEFQPFVNPNVALLDRR